MNLKSKKERREQILTPQKLANGRVRRFDAPQGLTLLEFVQQGLRLTTRRAFSIAEAMIVFTIVSVAIASVAPMISKQMLHNDMSDVQASVLNRRMDDIKDTFDDLQQSKWSLSSNRASITRPSGSVGIGVAQNVNPDAKLDINSSNPSQVGFNLSVPESMSAYIFKIKKGLLSVFSITSSGRVEVKNGLNIGFPYDSSVNFLSTYSDENNSDGTSIPRHVMYRNGRFLIQPSKASTWDGITVKNCNNDSSVAEEYKSSGVKIYKNDGVQLLSIGGIRMNYDDTLSPTSGGPFIMYVRGKRRFEINEAGRVVHFFAKGAPEVGASKTVFQIVACGNECGDGASTSTYFLVESDGTVSIPKTLKVAGKSVTASLDSLESKYAKLDDELAQSKQMIADSQKIIEALKAQNDLLSEKIAALENDSKQQMIKEVKKIASKNERAGGILTTFAQN